MTSPTEPTAPATPLPGGNPEDLAGLSYEQARAALDQVVSALESSTVNLEMSLALWERGTALADICRRTSTGPGNGSRPRVRA